MRVLFSRQHWTIVNNRAHSLIVANGRIARIRKIHEEGLRRFKHRIRVDCHVDCGREQARGDGCSSTGGYEVYSRGCRIPGRGVVDCYGLTTRTGQRNREGCRSRSTGPFHYAYIVNRDGWLSIVVRDRANTLPVTQRCVNRARKIDVKSLVRLRRCIAVNRDADWL